MAIAGLVLAAGAGRRFGRPKAAVELDGTTLAERAARALRLGGCDQVVVVLGPEVVDVASADVAIVHEGWEEGLGSSLRAGLAAVQGVGADQVVVLLCDQPWLGAEAVAAVIGGAGPGADRVAMATFGGVRAHPVLIGADHWAGVAAAASGEVGARAYLGRHPDLVVEVPCDGLGDPADVDRPEQLAAGQAGAVAAPVTSQLQGLFGPP